MNTTMLPLPERHWRTRGEQKLYVAFCEFASAVLGYAAGADALLRSRANSTRLNWAATSVYNSLVHSARSLVYLPVGDFPTSHAQLRQCFGMGRAVRTDWLKRSLHIEMSTTVGLPESQRFWSRFVAAQVVSSGLQWMDEVLAAARI